MKKFLFPFAAIALSWVACTPTTQYTITEPLKAHRKGMYSL